MLKDALHLLPTKYDDTGLPYWETVFTPTADKTRGIALVPPDEAIPVIFVPGIMGSNLKLIKPVSKHDGMIAWRPDNAGLGDAFRSSAGRQLLLNPDNTEVDTAITVKGKSVVQPVPHMSLKAAETRGWGSLMWGSYGNILTYLENNLQMPAFWEPTLQKVLLNAQWQRLFQEGIKQPNGSPLKLTDSELGRMCQFWFPVHAVGYNWLQSSRQSGVYLASKIDEIINFYKSKLGVDKCYKVILVTHSMGGLVARAAMHPSIGNAERRVLGVLHGVMPAIGAAATYKRMRSGFEGDGTALGWVVKRVLGGSGQDVTAVLGHSPGGLELLPNKRYIPGGWLKVTGVTPNPHTISADGNPYGKIYREKNAWWRLINPEWLDPAKRFLEKGKNSSWAEYSMRLREAESFHDTLGDYYHPNSYVYYGRDQRHPAFGNVEWKERTSEGTRYFFSSTSDREQLIRNGTNQIYADTGSGLIRIKWGYHVARMSIAPQDAPGDGTVPDISGSAPITLSPDNIKAQIALSGIDHQGAYDPSNRDVVDFIQYAICKITQEAGR